MNVPPPPDAADFKHGIQYPITPGNDHIPGTLEGMQQAHCLYEVRSFDPNRRDPRGDEYPFFIGVCLLRDVFHAPDMRRNSRGKEVRHNEMITIKIISIDHNVIRLNNIRYARVRELRPVANVQGYILTSTRAVITCVEGPFKDRQWTTQAQCSKETGIAQSAISAHLNNTPGYDTIHGCKFRRGM